MGEVIELTTSHHAVADVVGLLAPSVDETSIELTADHPVPDGEWVRFDVRLADGSSVLEGVGRAAGSTLLGAGEHRVRLTLLQFDVRNEIMFERIVLARDAIDGGPTTGKLPLPELAADLAARAAPTPPPPAPPRGRPPVMPSRPPAGSRPPPARRAPSPAAPARPLPPRPPSAAPGPGLRSAPPPPPGRPLGQALKPPPLPRTGTLAAPEPAPRVAVPSPRSVSQLPPRPVPSRASTLPGSAAAPTEETAPSETKPPAAKPAIPEAKPAPRIPEAKPATAKPSQAEPAGAKPATEPPAAGEPTRTPAPASALTSLGTRLPDAAESSSGAPSPSEPPPSEPRPSEPAPSEPAPPVEATAPQEIATLDTVVSRVPPSRPASASGLALDVPARLVARARALAPTLPDGVLEPDGRALPEEAVLRAALRLGLASLAALADLDDE